MQKERRSSASTVVRRSAPVQNRNSTVMLCASNTSRSCSKAQLSPNAHCQMERRRNAVCHNRTLTLCPLLLGSSMSQSSTNHRPTPCRLSNLVLHPNLSQPGETAQTSAVRRPGSVSRVPDVLCNTALRNESRSQPGPEGYIQTLSFQAFKLREGKNVDRDFIYVKRWLGAWCTLT